MNLTTYKNNRTQGQVKSQLMQNMILIVCRMKTSYDHQNNSKYKIWQYWKGISNKIFNKLWTKANLMIFLKTAIKIPENLKLNSAI